PQNQDLVPLPKEEEQRLWREFSPYAVIGRTVTLLPRSAYKRTVIDLTGNPQELLTDDLARVLRARGLVYVMGVYYIEREDDYVEFCWVHLPKHSPTEKQLCHGHNGPVAEP
ncbi:MAG: hypothetical protein AB7O65_01335, partial [Candidatus Korobacteraceae bacterium]